MSDADTKRIKAVENRVIHAGRAGEEEEKKDGQEEMRKKWKTKAFLCQQTYR